MAGRFVVFDGPDGCGKSTQLQRFADHLADHGVAVRTVRDPGGDMTRGYRADMPLADRPLTKLVAAAVGRYESIGGFDWAKETHKPARRYVPAGSVYFFECEGQSELDPDLINGAITDNGAAIGFGQIIIGRW